MRLAGRHLPRDWVLSSSSGFEIIESYPEDKYFPSFFVRGTHDEIVFHVLFATDIVGDNVRVVTAYLPSPDKWEEEGRRRRKA